MTQQDFVNEAEALFTSIMTEFEFKTEDQVYPDIRFSKADDWRTDMAKSLAFQVRALIKAAHTDCI